MSRDRLADPTYPNGDYTLSVLSYDKRRSRCPVCHAPGIVYVCDGHKLDWPRNEQIREMCKGCAIKAAGGEALVWVKTTFFKLRQVWTTGKRVEAAAGATEALSRYRQGLQERGQNAAEGASGLALVSLGVSQPEAPLAPS